MTLGLFKLGLTAAGIVILLYGMYKAFMFYRQLGEGRLAEAWYRVTWMIGLFVVGYIAFFLQVLTGNNVLDPELLSAIIFFAGSTFVAAVSKLISDVFQV
ncbi:MAG: hypothetical protein ABEJ93_04295 [Candidatus Nanohalobium sp.]